MWLLADYEAVTLFSLKMSSATSSGGKTLLVPTPFAVKIALLDVACRIMGVKSAEARWPEVRDLEIALRPASKVVVTNLFQKVLRPRRQSASEGDPDTGPFQKTIGYREYAQMIGPMGLALGWPDELEKVWLVDLLLQINYFGKRGSFMQVVQLPRFVNMLPDDYLLLTADQAQFALQGTMQILDDCAPDLGFSQVDVYSSEKIRQDKDRLFRNVVVPYRLARSSKSFSIYEAVS
ncbi:MAG: hypothetical protein JXA78_15030 [Anaerolineales bacterium]|nr:hypothetical protein [Anaerolineales bacterium]